MVLDLETNAGSFLQTDGTWTAQTPNHRNHSSMVKCWMYLQCLLFQCDTVDGSNPRPMSFIFPKAEMGEHKNLFNLAVEPPCWSP